jgi:hypothetical protein
VFAGAKWRMDRQAIMVAWYSVAMEFGSKEMKPLDELLGDAPQQEVSTEEYYRTLRRLGLR